ncbi:MAG TPA: ABC transporter ATP-binding protein [Firmicutes bacterium]|nr:ABC transporter ATP-binding protein [Bacillota bacterium]
MQYIHITFFDGRNIMIDINISKVCKSFGFDLVLNNIDITVQKGEKVGLIGTNGSGKSTILKIIAGQESIDSGSLSIRNNISIGYLSQIPEEKDIIVKDYINSAFKEIIELKEKLERYEDKLLTEDYKVITKYMNLQEKFISLGGYEYETKIQKILPVFNITEEILNRNFNTLSGGEKTIISLIRLLLQEPDVLLLDEPTNHLDINKMIWLEKTLKNYKGTIILVSHDRYFMDNVINKVYLLTKRGIEVYHGNYSYYIKESENRLLLELKNYKDQQKQITAMENSIKRLKEYGRLCGPSGGEIFFRRAASIEKRLEKLEKLDKPEDKKKLNITFDTASRSGKDVLTINNLNLSYGTKEIFNNLNLSIKYQDRLCLVGDNGVGKSTLIKEILKGNNSIKLGSNIKIGYIPQEIGFEDINLSVLEEARKYFIGPEQYLRSALFKYLFAGENIYKKIKYLSGGEKVRLKIFCLIQDSYNFLILDEPTNHIDIDTREMLEESLMEFTGTILFVSHDRYFINKIATGIIEIKNKNITKYIGNYDDYREKINKI